MSSDKIRKSHVQQMEQIILRRKGDCVFEGDALSNNIHTHSYEICFVIDGSGIQVHGGETIPLVPDDVFLAEPGVEHQVSAYDNGSLHVAYFIFDLVSDSRDSEPENIPIQFSKKHGLIVHGRSHLRPIIQQIRNYLRMGGYDSPWVEAAARLFILDALQSLADSPQPSATSNRVIEKAMSFIRSNLSWPPTLEQIAKTAGTSPRNLQLLFRKHLDKSVIEVLNTERCKLATEYLDMGFKVNQTGPIIGIDDPAQFSRFYKRYTGVSPSDRGSRKM